MGTPAITGASIPTPCRVDGSAESRPALRPEASGRAAGRPGGEEGCTDAVSHGLGFLLNQSSMEDK